MLWPAFLFGLLGHMDFELGPHVGHIAGESPRFDAVRHVIGWAHGSASGDSAGGPGAAPSGARPGPQGRAFNLVLTLSLDSGAPRPARTRDSRRKPAAGRAPARLTSQAHRRGYRRAIGAYTKRRAHGMRRRPARRRPCERLPPGPGPSPLPGDAVHTPALGAPCVGEAYARAPAPPALVLARAQKGPSAPVGGRPRTPREVVHRVGKRRRARVPHVLPHRAPPVTWRRASPAVKKRDLRLTSA
jgi:hypothetical protein